MKVLFFIDSLRAGGKERQLVELLKGLSLVKDCKCELAVMDKNVHYDTVKLLDIKVHYLIRRIKKDPLILLKLYKIFKEFKPDIIHTWDYMTTFYSIPIAKMLKTKILNGSIRYGLSIKRLGKLWILGKLLFPFSDVIVANSLSGLNVHKLAPSRKNRCIYNGFDFKRTKSLADKEIIRKRFGINTKYVVGMVANFVNAKDYQTYLSAAQMVIEKRHDVSFLCVGDGYNLKKSKEDLRKEFSSNILFLGKQTDIESIINIFDVGVLSCNTKGHAEGISNSILEYMALAKPVITTDSGGTKEIVNNRKTGYIINPFSINEMVVGINNLLNNKELRKEMGIAGQKRIKEFFSNDRMVNSFVDFYQELSG